MGQIDTNWNCETTQQGCNMRKRTIIAMLLAASMLAGMPATADPTVNSTVTMALDGYAIGDKLKITVFEVMGGANSFVERQELSGEYTVQQNGTLSVSFASSIPTVGKTQAQIEAALEETYLKMLGVNIKVTIRTIEREPIYITGPNLKPSYVKYTPGMIALQAVALAGGLDKSADWARIDIARERERLLKSQEKADVLRARLHILITERDEKAPTGEVNAAILIRENNLRNAEQQKHLGQIDALTTSIKMTTMELQLLRERLTSVETSLAQKDEWFKAIEGPYKKGLVTMATYHQVQSDLNTARERWFEVKTAIAQTERKMYELEQDKKRFIIENDLKRQTEIKDLTAALAEDSVTQKSIGTTLQDFGELPIPVSRGGNQIVIVILRQGAISRVQIEADLLTNLQPGDILQLKQVDKRLLAVQELL